MILSTVLNSRISLVVYFFCAGGVLYSNISLRGPDCLFYPWPYVERIRSRSGAPVYS